MGLMFLTAGPTDIVNLFDDARVNVTVVLSSWLTTNIGGSRNQRLLETITEFLGERFLGNTQCYRAIIGYQILRQVDSAVENDGCGLDSRRRSVGNGGSFLQTIDELPGHIRHITDISLQTSI